MKYGLIGKMLATSGKRDELIDVLLDGASGMPGCRGAAGEAPVRVLAVLVRG